MRRIRLADVNLDGRPDVVAAFDDAIAVLYNRLAPVGLEVEDFAALPTERSILLRWQMAPHAVMAASGVGVERATAAEGPYVVLTSRLLAPRREMSFEDTEVGPQPEAWYRLALRMRDGSTHYAGPIRARRGEEPTTRTTLALPREPATGAPVEIRYAIAPPGGVVRLGVYDARGRMLWRFGPAPHARGEYTRTWDRTNLSGGHVPRGVYLVRLEAGPVVASRKLVLLRP